MNFIPCVTWVKQGIAKRIPEKVSITKEELKEIIEENQEQLRTLGANELSDDDNDNNSNENETNVRNEPSRDIADEYDMDNYDEEDGDAVNLLAGLAGLTLYASNDDDPYMTIKNDDADSDAGDFEIHSDDNLIAVSHVEGDCSELEVYVYNGQSDYLYVHHSIMLSSVALCTEWLNFDPGEESPGNLIAVGNMTPVIEVWDLDVVDCLEPVFKLGEAKTKKKKRVKSSEFLGHTDAVLDLSWNKSIRNILGSASADNSIVLWDMAEGSVTRNITEFTDKVQTLEWHPVEAQSLVAGSYDNTAKLFDCRIADATNKIWTFDGEVERVLWDIHNPFYFYASTDKGFVYSIDVRNSEPVWTISAHSTACTGLTISTKCPGCLITASTDKTVKVWDIRETPVFVTEKTMNVGEIYCIQASPDSPFTICCGGDNRSHNLRVKDLGVACDRFQIPTIAHNSTRSAENSSTDPIPSSSTTTTSLNYTKKKKPKHLKRKQKR